MAQQYVCIVRDDFVPQEDLSSIGATLKGTIPAISAALIESSDVNFAEKCKNGALHPKILGAAKNESGGTRPKNPMLDLSKKIGTMLDNLYETKCPFKRIKRPF